MNTRVESLTVIMRPGTPRWNVSGQRTSNGMWFSSTRMSSGFLTLSAWGFTVEKSAISRVLSSRASTTAATPNESHRNCHRFWAPGVAPAYSTTSASRESGVLHRMNVSHVSFSLVGIGAGSRKIEVRRRPMFIASRSSASSLVRMVSSPVRVARPT